MSEIIIISAVAKNNVIGKQGKIPWHISEDFARFKQLTTGWPVIMGRKTFESLPQRPLPDRLNIVLSSQKELELEGAAVMQSLEQALEYCAVFEKVFIIGGQNVYGQGMKYADFLEITRIEKDFEGDAFFPEIKKEEWQLVKEEKRSGFSFQTFKRRAVLG